MKRTISGMVGKGSVRHNQRVFTAENVNREKTKENIIFKDEKLRDVYTELFQDALEKYNERQTRNDRKIPDYYEHIRTGKQEKLFHEVIFQIGNKDDMNVDSDNGQLAKELLTEFMQNFEERNPNLRVFFAVIHVDEQTPHFHIDFVPYTSGSKRGLETRVSLKKALQGQGFSGGTKNASELNQWMQSEKEELSKVMERHGIEWAQKGTHEKHLPVLDFKLQERQKEIEETEKQLAVIQKRELDLERVHQIIPEKRPLTKKVTLKVEVYNFLIEIAEQYLSHSRPLRALQQIIKDLKEAIKRLEERNRVLDEKLRQYFEGWKKLKEENQKLKEKAFIAETYFRNMRKTNVKYKNLLEKHGLLGKSRSHDLER